MIIFYVKRGLKGIEGCSPGQIKAGGDIRIKTLASFSMWILIILTSIIITQSLYLARTTFGETEAVLDIIAVVESRVGARRAEKIVQ